MTGGGDRYLIFLFPLTFIDNRIGNGQDNRFLKNVKYCAMRFENLKIQNLKPCCIKCGFFQFEKT